MVYGLMAEGVCIAEAAGSNNCNLTVLLAPQERPASPLCAASLQLTKQRRHKKPHAQQTVFVTQLVAVSHQLYSQVVHRALTVQLDYADGTGLCTLLLESAVQQPSDPLLAPEG